MSDKDSDKNYEEWAEKVEAIAKILQGTSLEQSLTIMTALFMGMITEVVEDKDLEKARMLLDGFKSTVLNGLGKIEGFE